MPLYEYCCPRCGNVIELIQRYDDEFIPDCDDCRQEYRDTTAGYKMIRVMSVSSFILKGGCWEKDGYKK